MTNYQEKLRCLSLTLPSRNLLLSAPIWSFWFSGFWLFSWCLLSSTSSGSWLIWWSEGLLGAGGSLLICLALPVTDFWSTLWVSAFTFSFLLWRNSFILCYSQGRSAFSRLHKKWKVFVGVNSSNSAWWNEEVDIGYLPMDHLP